MKKLVIEQNSHNEVWFLRFKVKAVTNYIYIYPKPFMII